MLVILLGTVGVILLREVIIFVVSTIRASDSNWTYMLVYVRGEGIQHSFPHSLDFFIYFTSLLIPTIYSTAGKILHAFLKLFAFCIQFG